MNIVDAHGRPYTRQRKAASGNNVRRRVVASFRDERFGSLFDSELAGWRSLSGAAGTQPLFLMQQDYLQMLSYWLYFTNNIIGGMIEKMTDVMVGNGFGFSSKNDAVQACLDEFWERDRINNFQWLQDVYTSWLTVFGESCFTVFTRPDGSLKVGFVEPYNIDRTYTDPGNPFVVTGVRLKSDGLGSGAGKDVLTTVLDPTKPKELLFDKDTRTQRDGFRVQGEKAYCFFWYLNPRIVPADDENPCLRGTPSLLASFDPATDAEDIIHSMSRRADMASRILWDVTIDDAGEDDINDFLDNQGIPDEYTLNAHNNKVHWNLISPDLKASEHETQHRITRNYAIGGKGPGMPPTWFGDGTDANRANAQELPFTTMSGLKRRQHKQGLIFSALAEYQLIQKGLPLDYDTIYPTMSEKDQQKQSATMQSLTSTLTVAEQQEYVTKDEARRIWRANVEDMGHDLGEYKPTAQPEGSEQMTPDYANMYREAPASRNATREAGASRHNKEKS